LIPDIQAPFLNLVVFIIGIRKLPRTLVVYLWISVLKLNTTLLLITIKVVNIYIESKMA
jgi:hypothetical protein